MLAGGMCVIPFLQPRHMPPIGTFYDEWLAFALGLAAIGFAAGDRRNSATHVPVLAWCLVLFSLFLFVRALGAWQGYFQSPLLWSLYVIFAAALVILGHALATRFGQERVCDFLASVLLAGALANSLAGVLQIMGIPKEIDSFVSNLRGIRATGNLGQANLYANYIALGEASLVYLFARARLGRMAAFTGGILLVGAASLAASRGTILYSAAFAFLGFIAISRQKDERARRVGYASLALGASAIAMQWLVPAGMNLLGFHLESGFRRNESFESEGTIRDEAMHLRLVAWNVAYQLFMNSPWFGVGPDGFAGAAFAAGLPPEMSGNGVWTSPHNLLLHLLAETGLVGTAFVVFGLVAWLLRAGSRFWRHPDARHWWLLGCVGVECLHAMLEYPFWYAHFLALTALIMGVGTRADNGHGVELQTNGLRVVFASCAAVGTILIGVHLAAYFDFDRASPVAAGRSLASDGDIERDRDSLKRLSGTLLAPHAELWLFLALPFDAGNSAEKIALGERVLQFWPSRVVVVRQSIFLALAGRREEAVALLSKSLRTFRTQDQAIAEAIQAAPQAARDMLLPALSGHSQ